MQRVKTLVRQYECQGFVGCFDHLVGYALGQIKNSWKSKKSQTYDQKKAFPHVKTISRVEFQWKYNFE